MYNNTLEFVEKVKDLAKLYGLEVSITPAEVPIRLRIDKARVEILMTAKRCTVTDGQGNKEPFEKSLGGWDQMSLEYIEKLLTTYKKFRRPQ